MIRKIIEIDQNKCNGCGLCVFACHEGAIGMIDGKAKLLRDDYCDGLGDCLPACPVNAISFVEREAAAYNEEAVKEHSKNKHSESLPCGCPGTNLQTFNREARIASPEIVETTSQLNQWPIQIKLVPVNAPYFHNAHLLISADCAAYAHGNFHNSYMQNKITLIGCPKLDFEDYSEKLTDIIKSNQIKSVTVVRMEVPCCSGIEHAVKTAIKNSFKDLPIEVITLSTKGHEV